ncbi:MAG: hypothetical protein VKS61_08930 [Candidatus Sericytochromatia bacterium]|nr:hypothetical protein [Candidatus Sericytochromatia bacterium]
MTTSLRPSLIPLATLLILAACAAPPTQAPTGPTELRRNVATPAPSSRASTAASPGFLTETPAPSGQPSTAASGPPTSPVPTSGLVLTPLTGTPTPSTSDTATPLKTSDFRPLVGTPNANGKTTLRGSVYKSDGTKILRGPKVRLVLADNRQREVDVLDGAFEIAGEPEIGDEVTITANWYGYAPRTQRVRLARGNDYTLNFGEPGKETEVFGLSTQPEVSAVTPVQNAKDVPGNVISLAFNLSEALNEEAIKNFVTSVRLLPANETAVDGATAPVDLSPGGPDDVLKAVAAKPEDYPYMVQFFTPGTGAEPPKGQSFVGAVAGYGVDGSARNITVNFPVPLLNGQSPGRYQVALVHDPARPIKDVDGNLLGTDRTGTLNSAPAAGEFLNNVFVSPFIGAATFKADNENTRWDSTHVNATAFTLAPDKTPPALAGFAVRVVKTPDLNIDTLGPGTYMDFTFNEAVVAYTKDKGVSRAPLRDVANYTFAVGLNTEYLSSTVLLSGGKGANAEPPINLPITANDFGAQGDSQLGKEFKLVADAGATVTIDVVALNRVLLFVPNTELFNRLNAKAIMARVEAVQDPAKNAVPAATADKLENQPRAAIVFPPVP